MRALQQVDSILEWEGLHSWPRRIMKLDRLEFIKGKSDWWILQMWKQLWGTDFETQKEMAKKCHSEYKDFISCISVSVFIAKEYKQCSNAGFELDEQYKCMVKLYDLRQMNCVVHLILCTVVSQLNSAVRVYSHA